VTGSESIDVPDDPAPEVSRSGDAGPAVERAVPDRRLLDQIFGDVLPDTTNDERDAGSGSGSYSEQWYRENRPPHHG